MLSSRISPSTQHPAKCIKAPMVGKNLREGSWRIKGRQKHENSCFSGWLRQSTVFPCSAPATITTPNTQSPCSVKSTLKGAMFSEIRHMERKRSGTILNLSKPPIRFLRRTIMLIRGPLIGIPTRNDTWLNASFRNSNGSAECSPATRSSMPRSWLSFTLHLLLYC